MIRSALRLTIERLALEGDGVARLEGRAVFVPGALPGDTVDADVDIGQHVWRAEASRRVTPSPHRRPPACPIQSHCGGCAWMALDDTAQARAKEEVLLSSLEHLGGISRSTLEVRPWISPPPTLGYRRRATLRWGPGGLGYSSRRTHAHVAVPACPVLVSELSQWPAELSRELGPIRDDIELVQLLAEPNQRAVALTLKGRVRSKVRAVAEALVRSKRVAGVVLTPKFGAAELIGKPTFRTLAPETQGVPLYLRPDVFCQAHAAAAPLLVGTAMELLAPEATHRVLELFSGSGLFTFALAARAAAVVAVEGSSLAMALAQRSAREAGSKNVRFVQGEVRQVLAGLSKEKATFDLLLADPPRTGDPTLGETARRLGVRRVVYVACDAGALARDAAALVKAGFRPGVLQGMDLFPQTHRLEAVMSFTRGVA